MKKGKPGYKSVWAKKLVLALVLGSCITGASMQENLVFAAGDSSYEASTDGTASASGTSAVAIGNSATASSDYTTAIGQQALASGNSSTAIGQAAEASGNFSIANGTLATAAGENSIAVGYYAKAGGKLKNLDDGTYTIYGDNSTAIGQYAQAGSSHSTAIGSGALAGSMVTGVGKSRAAFGQAYVGDYSTAIGDSANAAGDNSTATGQGAVAGGLLYNTANNPAFERTIANATANGQGAQAIGDNSTAVGQGALAGGVFYDNGDLSQRHVVSNATALGQGAQANFDNSTALGQGAQANAGNSVALGAGSVATRPSSVSVGAPGAERTITNVAEGTSPNDAVNYRQMSRTGALAAALSGLSVLPYDPHNRTQIAVSGGFFHAEQALALGVNHYVKENILLNLGVAKSSDDYMGRLGLTWRLGKDNAGKTVNGTQVSVVSDLQTKVKQQNEKISQLETQNVKMQTQIDELKKLLTNH